MAALIGGCKKEKEPEKVVVKMEKAGRTMWRYTGSMSVESGLDSL